MIAHVFDRQPRTVETPCPADEKPRNVPGANRIDLAGNRAVPVYQEGATGATSAGSSL